MRSRIQAIFSCRPFTLAASAEGVGLEDCRLRRLGDSAGDARDLKERLLAFYGVGPITMNIFLRELRPFCAKSAPDPLPAVERIAKELGVDLDHYDQKSLTFARLEAGLGLYGGGESARRNRQERTKGRWAIRSA